MQSKVNAPTSNPEARGSRSASPRRWTAAIVPLAALLAFGAASTLSARTPEPRATGSTSDRVQQLATTDQSFGRLADADRDLGPGEAESLLAQHPVAAHR